MRLRHASLRNIPGIVTDTAPATGLSDDQLSLMPFPEVQANVGAESFQSSIAGQVFLSSPPASAEGYEVPFITKNRPIPRRQAICLIGGGTFALTAGVARGASGIGTVVAINGPGQVGQPDRLAQMLAGMALFEGDLAVTGSEGRAHLGLGRNTEIHLGPVSELRIDKFIADIGGAIYLNGAIVFDRDDAAPPINLEFQTDFGRIAVRGTRFFAGPSENAFAVFVERGTVAVSGGSVIKAVKSGQGIDLRGNNVAPGPVGKWSQSRVDDAFSWVMGR